MAVISTGATLLQANASKLWRPLDTVDLEELADSRERAGAPVQWLSCVGQADVWEMFSDSSYWSAILDRQRLLVAAPADLRTKEAENFTPQPLQFFWYKLEKKKNLKIVVTSPTVATKSYKQQEVIWQQHHLCLAVAEHQTGGTHVLMLGPETGRIWWLKKEQYTDFPK